MTATKPPVRILREREVIDLTGISSVSIWRMERTGDFPRRRKLGIGNLVGWLSTEVEEWVRSREPSRLDDGPEGDGE